MAQRSRNMKTPVRTLLTIIFFFMAGGIIAQPGQTKLVISHLTGDYYIFTTYAMIDNKPFPANGMYVVTDQGVIMLDTPWDTTQFQPLLDSIKLKHNKPVTVAIATHAHEDRTGGLNFLRNHGVKTYTTTLTDEISRQRHGVRAQYLIEKDTTFKIGQHTLRVDHPGKGHTADNIIVWFEEDKILYGGCLVKSTDADALGNLSDASVPEWKTTIKYLKKAYPHARYFIPGHQSWASNKSLNHTLRLLRKWKSR